MENKEAIERLKNYPKDWITSAGELVLPLEIELAVSALEKVPVLEAENARLRELAFNHCYLHGFDNTPNYQKMFFDGKCEGYCRGVDDDEPFDECKECIINEFYEE